MEEALQIRRKASTHIYADGEERILRAPGIRRALNHWETARRAKVSEINSQNPVYDQLRAYKLLLEHNPVLRARFNHDRTLGMEAIGTLARYDLTVQGMPKNFEGRSPSQLNLLLRKFLAIIDNGVGTLVCALGNPSTLA